MTDTCLWVSDVDQLYAECSARGAVIQLPPTNQTGGNRETGIRDPDGNVLVFATKPRDTDLTAYPVSTSNPDGIRNAAIRRRQRS
jgi:hypothetical protein